MPWRNRPAGVGKAVRMERNTDPRAVSPILPPTLEWAEVSDGPALRLLDQTRLPTTEVVLDLTTVDEVCEAIKSLRVRGAPAIGCAAALGMALCAARSSAQEIGALRDELRRAHTDLAATRPTAVNLFWALGRMAARLGGER